MGATGNEIIDGRTEYDPADVVIKLVYSFKRGRMDARYYVEAEVPVDLSFGPITMKGIMAARMIGSVEDRSASFFFDFNQVSFRFGQGLSFSQMVHDWQSKNVNIVLPSFKDRLDAKGTGPLTFRNGSEIILLQEMQDPAVPSGELSLPLLRTYKTWKLLTTEKIINLSFTEKPSQRVLAITEYWTQVAHDFAHDPKTAFLLSPRKFEEFVAGAFKMEGFEEVILTPASGDGGLDVIASRVNHVPQVVAVSVKLHGEGAKFKYRDVRELIGVLDAAHFTNGQFITTGDAPPLLHQDQNINRYFGKRISVMTLDLLHDWVHRLIAASVNKGKD